MRFLMLVLLIGLSACKFNARPVANLTFSTFQKVHAGYMIEFYSDIDIDSLFASAHTRKVVAKKLICALEDDRDFSVEHNMARFFRGGVEFQEAVLEKSRQKYRYLSDGIFYLSFDNGSQVTKLTEDEVVSLLSNKKEIECKVIMTIFLSRPYYSATMKISAEKISDLLKAAKE